MQVQASLQGSGATPLLEGRRRTPLPACLAFFSLSKCSRDPGKDLCSKPKAEAV